MWNTCQRITRTLLLRALHLNHEGLDICRIVRHFGTNEVLRLQWNFGRMVGPERTTLELFLAKDSITRLGTDEEARPCCNGGNPHQK